MRRELIPIVDEFLSDGSMHDIGRCYDTHYVYSVRKWQNGAKGAIVDWYDINEEIDTDGNSLFVKEGGCHLGHRDSLQFVRSEIDLVRKQETYPGLSDGDMWKQCPLVAEGIIARFVKIDPTDRDYPAMFEAYYEMEKAFYVRLRRMDDQFSFKANLEDEFANDYHLSQEQENIKYSLRHLLPFLEEREHSLIIWTAKAYIEYVKSRTTKTIEPQTNENSKKVESPPEENDGSSNPDNSTTAAVVCPQGLTNTIFRGINEHGNEINMEKFWYWIYNNFVCYLAAKYEWLALLLFFQGHDLLKIGTTTKGFCEQMSTWFEKEYTNQTCSYNQVTAYQTGFFRSDKFNYRKWVACDGKLPLNWTPNSKDQKEEGYERIHRHCKRMEKQFKYSEIIVIVPNK